MSQLSVSNVLFLRRSNPFFLFYVVISYPPSNTAEGDEMPFMPHEYSSNNSFIGQDQGWIWGWNYKV